MAFSTWGQQVPGRNETLLLFHLGTRELCLGNEGPQQGLSSLEGAGLGIRSGF